MKTLKDYLEETIRRYGAVGSSPGMGYSVAEDSAAVKYGVFAKGGSVGSQRFRDDPLKTFDSKEEAIADARRRRSGLSKGERGYYRMSYIVKPIKSLSEGIMDTVKQAFNDCVVGYPQGTSAGQFIQGWARAIRAETGRDIPLEKLAKLYDDYAERSDKIMQSHGTTNEGVAEGIMDEALDKENRARLRNRIAADALNFYSLNDRIPKTSEFSRSVKSKLNSLEFDERSELYRQGVVQALKLLGKQRESNMDEGEGMSRAAKGYEKYGKAGMQALAKAGREGRALDPVRQRYDQYNEDAVVESLIDDDSTDIRDLLSFNLFRDYQSFKDGDIDDPAELQQYEQLFAAWGPEADKLQRQINAAAASGAVLTPEQNQEINDNWYDGSDAYDDPLRELPGIYAREIPVIRKILRQSTKAREGMAEAGRPDVMRHRGDTTVKVVKRRGVPVGEIGIDAEASEGNGQYYVKLYDGSYDASGFDTAAEALAELKYAISSGMEEDAASNDPLLAKAVDLAPVGALEESAELRLILQRAKLIE